MYQITRATRKIAALKARIRAAQGGTSASKTVSIVLNLIHLAQSDKKPTLTSIVSESFPHLKRGVMRDFQLIMEEHGYFQDARWNKTDYTYTFETGSKIEFFSADQPDKVRGPRRDRLFINEANNIPYEAFDQLEVRTKEFIFLDWNPTFEFWFYDKVKGRDDCEHIILTYKDNEALDENIVKSIEQHKGDKQWWMVYGLGLLGEVEGKIYKGWEIIDEIPHEARLEVRGMDFGYSNDPSALIAIYAYNGGIVLDEELFRKELLNKQIADHILLLKEPHTPVIADSAEPKSIEEIRQYGVTMLGANKGQGSVNQGIQFVQQKKISMTKRSLNLIKAYRNYLWETDKLGNIINKPSHLFSDAMDAVRYGMTNYMPTDTEQEMRDLFRINNNRETKKSFK